jgi:hypothetical protein
MSVGLPDDSSRASFDDPEIQAAWERSHNIVLRLAEARRVDPMPDPEKLTVGETIDFITFITNTSQGFSYLLEMPEVRQQYNDRNKVLFASPGWRAFQEWRDIEHHRKSPLEAANELLALLVERLHKPSQELRQMRLLDAVRLLEQGEMGPTAPAISLTPRRREILEALAKSKKRLSKPRLFRAMASGGSDISRNTLNVETAKMRNAGWIDNEQTKGSQGFAITELGISMLATKRP